MNGDIAKGGKILAGQTPALQDQLKLIQASLQELANRIEGSELVMVEPKPLSSTKNLDTNKDSDLHNWGTSELIVKLEFENSQLKKNIEILDYQSKKSNPSNLKFWFVFTIVIFCACLFISLFPFLQNYFPFLIPTQISSIAMVLLLGLAVLIYQMWLKIDKLTQKRRMLIVKKIEAQDLKNYINQKLEKVSYIIDLKSEGMFNNE